MPNLLQSYMNWLHTRWPAGTVEKLPRVNPDGTTNVPGLYVTGDLTGIPLLKFAADSGARVVQHIVADPAFQALRRETTQALDLVIVGGGVSGMAAALEAQKQKLAFELYEASEPFSTIVNFPKGKPIFTYPTDMVPAGDLQFHGDVKEPLVEDLKEQCRATTFKKARVETVKKKGKVFEVKTAEGETVLAHRVIVAIGRSGNFRKLGVSGEDSGKVFNRLHDPKDFAGKDVLVVGGGDSAIEAAIALAQVGASVTISYRKREFARPKPENVERLEALERDPMAKVAVETPSSERVTTASGAYMEGYRRPGHITRLMPSTVKTIGEDSVVLELEDKTQKTLPNDAVFTMIGREPPLDFFRRAGVHIHGETVGVEWAFITMFFLAVFLVYDWKSDGFLFQNLPSFAAETAFPKSAPKMLSSLSPWLAEKVNDRTSVIGTLAMSMKSRSFYYTLGYTALIGFFGWKRIQRRKTPYVKWQTISLFLVQFIPLFLLPELILPWLGYNGHFTAGVGRTIADNLFELYISPAQLAAAQWPEWGHPRAFWRAYGFILAWPLMVYNVFTEKPNTWWLGISFLQTFAIIPALIYFYGKGVYCGWICSCGGLAETLGDDQRHKMPHGAASNRLNMLGQVLLLLAFILLGIRVVGWIFPQSIFATSFNLLLEGKNKAGQLVNPLAWKWSVDLMLAGIIAVGLYFKYSGRLWCRFACPLAALMHIYARFSKFRILADKKKCISCNVCTSVCHMGIDVMNFANKGLPMADPQCVRCSACVQSCPTGVLSFGMIDRKTGEATRRDKTYASLVHMREGKPQPH